MTSRRGLLAFVFTVTLTGILNNTLVTPAIPDILAEFGQPDARSGWLVATGSVAGIVVAPTVGVLADRIGRRVVLTTCLAIFGTFGAVAALAPSFELLLGARLLQGFGSAGLVNLAVVLIGDHFDGAERTLWVGRNGAVLTVGLATFPSISGAITQAAGWRVTFGLYTLAFLTAVVAWTRLRADRPDDPPEVADQLRGIRQVVRRGEVAFVLFLGFLLFVIVFGAFLAVMPIHLAREFGLEAGGRGLVLSSPSVTSSLVSFNLGRIRTRLSMRRLAITATIIFTVGFTLMATADTLWVLLAGTFAYGSSMGMLIGSLQDESVELSPVEHRGAIVAAFVGAARTGQTAGPLLVAVLLGFVGTGTALLVAAGLSAAIAVLAAVGPLRRTVARPRTTATRTTHA